MSEKEIKLTHYEKLMSIFTGYNDVYNALYRLKTTNEEVLNSIYKKIKQNLIGSYNFSQDKIIKDISNLSIYNNSYMRSYLAITKQIVDEYHPKQVNKINKVFNYLFYKEYSIVLNENKKKCFKKYEDSHYSSNIHDQYTIHKSIMDNDKKALIAFTEREGFDENQRVKSELYPKNSISLLELCCYHGSDDCFKFLRTNFQSKITRQCLRFSFLSGNQEIMNECLKMYDPDQKCMRNAIKSHNIDFVTYLMNEHNLKIDLDCCCSYNNIQAFLIYLEQTNDINTCFAYSPIFCLLPLLEYFILNGAIINARNQYGYTPLHYAARDNNKKLVELLISHGADVNIIRIASKLLHHAIRKNYIEVAEILISHGADVNAKNQHGYIPLHYAASKNHKEIAKLFISHGADVNAKNLYEYTPLHYAARENNKEIAELLVSNGADINAINKDGYTPLHHAARGNNKEIVEILILHGADINTKDKSKFGSTALHRAAFGNCKETAELLISHDADVNAKNLYGFTPLHNAARRNN
ncbi:ankyrin repeat protein, putative [Trichomonas vaginalis G3]|uniref:Ankyrin repeat protein, putative n=1 Tax=Trichomonas vaginalis (strain ATCC PRA-98 / G3) TaxID=412133 RepID=A2FAZ4_TRIV3|nr:ankyrin repeat protein, putative [Trichomonas vaginalis G3]|eukprot:XP_001310852.1 ankyrin repeat protein [Trichomonas vaginalis G3]